MIKIGLTLTQSFLKLQFNMGQKLDFFFFLRPVKRHNTWTYANDFYMKQQHLYWLMHLLLLYSSYSPVTRVLLRAAVSLTYYYTDAICICTSVKNVCIKLNGEVRTVVPKSTQTIVVRIITYMLHPHACFSQYGARSCIHVFINLLTCKASYFN